MVIRRIIDKSIGAVILVGENRSTLKKAYPSAPFLAQLPHEFPWSSTESSIAENQWQTD
jgi:hypothetical protein